MRYKIDDIVVDFNTYPRTKPDGDVIKQYRQNIDSLPPISVQKAKKILIDGFHRLRAHIEEGKKEIEVDFVDIPENEILKYAIIQNARHGRQLESEEKERWVRHFWENGYKDEYDELEEIFAISRRTIQDWTKDIRQKEDDVRDQKILDLWLRCWTQEEIADETGVTQQTIANKVESITKNSKIVEICNAPPASLDLYDVWTFCACDNRYGDKYPGRIPGQIIENTLWYYTKPFDIVLDPMVGSGTTLDVCKAMYRRSVGFDIAPFRADIIKRDTVKDGFPEKFKHPDYKPHLVFVDPPYWNMKAENYAKGSISELSIEDYYKSIGALALHSRGVLRDSGIFAFLIQNETDKPRADDPVIHTHNCADAITNAGFNFIRQINVPQSTETYPAYKVANAKQERRLLGIVRDLLIMRKE